MQFDEILLLVNLFCILSYASCFILNFFVFRVGFLKSLAWLVLFIYLFSPYSISIMPLRQDNIGDDKVLNANLLNFFNFYKFAGFSFFDLLFIFLSVRAWAKCRFLYFSWVTWGLLLVSFIGLCSYWITYLFDPSKLDSVIDSCLGFREVISIMGVSSILFYLFRDGLVRSLRILGFNICLYLSISVLIMSFTSDAYVWIKYSYKFFFLDQADYSLVILLFVIGFSLKNRLFVLMAMFFSVLTLLSGVKAYFIDLFFICMTLMYWRLKYKQPLILGTVGLFIFFNIAVAFYLGANKIDTSIYTRYYQTEQLFAYNWTKPYSYLTGIGFNKSYKTTADPELIDEGAFSKDEMNSTYKIGFQMPYIMNYRNVGLLGMAICILVCFLLARNAVYFSMNPGSDTIRRLGYFVLPLLVSLYGFNFPFFGNKVIFCAAFIFVLFSNRAVIEKRLLIESESGT